MRAHSSLKTSDAPSGPFQTTSRVCLTSRARARIRILSLEGYNGSHERAPVYIVTYGARGREGYVDNLEGEWRTTCPKGCRSDEGNPVSLRPILHMFFDPDLYHELNVERYELSRSGKLLFNHPQGTNVDLFWATALAVYTAEQEPPPLNRPIA